MSSLPFDLERVRRNFSLVDQVTRPRSRPPLVAPGSPTDLVGLMRRDARSLLVLAEDRFPRQGVVFRPYLERVLVLIDALSPSEAPSGSAEAMAAREGEEPPGVTSEAARAELGACLADLEDLFEVWLQTGG